MLPIISKNRFLNALFLLMLFSAILHMLILFYLAFSQKNPQILNYFNILDLDLLFPHSTILSLFSLGTLVAASIYLIFFVLSKKENS